MSFPGSNDSVTRIRDSALMAALLDALEKPVSEAAIKMLKKPAPWDKLPPGAMRVAPGTDAVVWRICPDHSGEL